MTDLRINSDAPTHFLEQQASEQRRRIHDTVAELRQQVRGTVRDKLDVRRHAREHVWQAAGTAFLFSLLFGYGATGTVKHLVR
jgi:hypothetical protein